MQAKNRFLLFCVLFLSSPAVATPNAELESILIRSEDLLSETKLRSKEGHLLEFGKLTVKNDRGYMDLLLTPKVGPKSLAENIFWADSSRVRIDEMSEGKKTGEYYVHLTSQSEIVIDPLPNSNSRLKAANCYEVAGRARCDIRAKILLGVASLTFDEI